VAKDRIVKALTASLGSELAKEIVADFAKVRQDFATRTLERASPGKFVETFVQCLQHIGTGAYDAKPDVDRYLDKVVENQTKLPEGLRVCAARAARTMYTMRNKRNIAHKNEIDPNVPDLALLERMASWIMTELVRGAQGVSMEEAAALIELLQAPVGALVEEINGVRLVHAHVSIRAEVLILLHHRYPEFVSVADMRASVGSKRASSIAARLAEMKSEKLIFGDAKQGYRLTQAGHAAALKEVAAAMAA
jgi:hypothetical protein